MLDAAKINELAEMSPQELADLLGPELDIYIQKIQKVEAAQRASKQLLTFMQYINPDPDAPDDITRSKYEAHALHKVLAEALEKVDRGEMLRLAISVPPQMGKTAICTKGFPAWIAGKYPHRDTIIAAYNQSLAETFGTHIRRIMESREYQEVFPKLRFEAGVKSKKEMMFEDGGSITMIGRDGSGTGRSADLFIIDDPYKNKTDTDSLATREEVWSLYTRVVNSRMRNTGAVIVIHCMTGDTPVMLADFSEKPLRDIKVGDKVATFKDGRLDVATVKNWASQGVDSIYAIRTASGRTVRANARHPFLISEAGQWKWIKTKDLRLGHEMCRVNGVNGRAKLARMMDANFPSYVAGTATPITQKSDGLMAFARRRISAKMRAASDTLSTAMESHWMTTSGWNLNKAVCAQFASAPLGRMSERIGAGNCASITATTAARCGRFYAMTATLSSATQKLLTLLWPQPNISDFTLDRIVEIVPAGMEEVFDVQIDGTENFIANGLVSHNTRWHEDDLIGRLTDPTNPHYNAEVAKQWTYINIPEIMDDEEIAKILGKKVGDALWPERRSLALLNNVRLMDPAGFSALHMGKPTPPDGAFFQIEHLRGYEHKQIPKNLRFYLSGDLAVSTKSGANKSAVGIWGIDSEPEPNLWLMPQLLWKRSPTDETVEWIIESARQFGILTAYWEKGQIDNAVGPFLERRMMERVKKGEGQWFHLEKFPTSGDKGKRAQSFRSLAAMGRVRFPTFAPWWPAAKDQMLKFTGSGNDLEDDFADMCGIMGQAANQILRGHVPKASNVVSPKVGTLAWTRWASDADKRRRNQPGRIVRAF